MTVAAGGEPSRKVAAARRPLGLRARVTVAFALGAFILSAVFAGVTYSVVRSSIVQQREQAAEAQAFLNARVVRDALRSPDADAGRILAALEAPTGGIVVHHREQWFANSLTVGSDALPGELREDVLGGGARRQRFVRGREPWLAVGIPMPRVEAEFFQVFSLAEVDRILRTLGFALVGAAAMTTLAGAGLGRWASARVVRPLTGVSEAARAIAGGQLDIRLPSSPDSDLEPLVTSFNRMVDALADRIQRDARFASDVSHELRSPLTTLATSAEILLARRAELTPRAQAAVDLLVADVRRFQRMVEDLLEISRVDAGVVDLHLEEVDLVDLVRHALDDPGDGAKPQVEGCHAVAVVDKRRLERVVVNLVENATLHAGGATRVGVERAPEALRIVVEDEGPGIPVVERSKIFDRFFRGSASGRRGTGGGSGLGLALVAEHVRLHGGRVWVEDGEGGRGARFVVELPVSP